MIALTRPLSALLLGTAVTRTRKLAAKMGVNDITVHKVWKVNGLKPHLVETFKISRDLRFIEKLEDIVGLSVSPPEHALVLCWTALSRDCH